MPTFSSRGALAAVAAACTVALSSLSLLACAPEGSCIRFSDCASGSMCADGLCVKPGEPTAPATTELDPDAAADAQPTPASDASTRDARADARDAAPPDAPSAPATDASDASPD